MSRHPGLGPEQSGSNAFFSDANLDLRAEPAGYADFAPLPGEAIGDALAGSPALQAVQRHGGPLQPLQLAEIEVDDGGRSADQSDWLEQPEQSYVAPYPIPPAPVVDSRIDALESKFDQILRLLGGSN